MSEEYKTDKEAFVSRMAGSSITHINLVSLMALVRPPNVSKVNDCLGQASVSLYAAIQTRLQPTRPIDFLSSYLLLVLPLLLSMTLFANKPTILLVLLSVFTGLLLYLPKPKGPGGVLLPFRQPLVSSASTSSSPVRIPPLPALTTY